MVVREERVRGVIDSGAGEVDMVGGGVAGWRGLGGGDRGWGGTFIWKSTSYVGMRGVRGRAAGRGDGGGTGDCL